MTGRTRLPIHIPEPCHEDWGAMPGAGHVRHCARCDEDVVDLMALPDAEIGRVLQSGACLRVDLRAAARRLVPAAALGLALSGCAATLVQLEVTPTVAPYDGTAVEPEAPVVDVPFEDICDLDGN